MFFLFVTLVAVVFVTVLHLDAPTALRRTWYCAAPATGSHVSFTPPFAFAALTSFGAA